MNVRENKIEEVSKIIEQKWNYAKEKKLVTEKLSTRVGKSGTGFVELDLHENGDGPHMLVAGTTGSGKTETIITYLLGLCMNYGPDELNLLLVDMKGGGFTKRIGHLPHVVGHITDVEGDENGTGAEYMLRRFLHAMTAEIKRRKMFFNSLRVDCIDDYIKRYREIENEYRKHGESGIEKYAEKNHIEGGFKFKSLDEDEVSPLAHLILIVDEFTELKRFSSQSNDVDFISEITTIARVGRSLGFHIVLISQNIEGAITEDIRVNSNARICHKVATSQASKEMIGSGVAAAPTMPGNGRAYLVSGNGKRLEYFQAGYSKLDTDEVMPVKIELANKSGAYALFYNSEEDNTAEQKKREKKQKKGEYLTQLELITRAICKAYERRKEDYLRHEIFKQPLKKVLDYGELETLVQTQKKSANEIVLGQYDDPEKQEQPLFFYNHIKENMIVFGGTGSGKTVLVKNLLLQMNRAGLNEEVYIIDFGGNIGDYKELKNVYGCFDNSNEEDVKRVFQRVRKRFGDNTKALGSENFVSEYEKDAKSCPKHVTLIIENVNAFLEDERYSNYREELTLLCREGLSKGVSVVLTAKTLSGLARLMVHFGKRIAFEMPSENYWDIFNTKVLKPIKNQGRGLADCENVVREVQIACFSKEKEQKLLEEYRGFPGDARIKAFEEKDFLYNVNDEKKECTEETGDDSDNIQIVVGREYYKQEVVKIEIPTNRCVAIYGKKQFGKTNLLQLLLTQIEKKYQGKKKYTYWLLDDGRNQLSEENLPYFYNLFPDKYDVLGQKVGKERIRRMTSQNIQNLGRLGELGKEGCEKDSPKVVVLQGREFYNRRFTTSESDKFVEWVEGELGIQSCSEDILIFSDVKRCSSSTVQEEMKTWFQCAFLLDNIGDFVADKGRGSVFGEMDAKELKTEYANCNLGDGFFYDVEADELKKLRFYKCIGEK